MRRFNAGVITPYLLLLPILSRQLSFQICIWPLFNYKLILALLFVL